MSTATLAAYRVNRDDVATLTDLLRRAVNFNHTDASLYGRRTDGGTIGAYPFTGMLPVDWVIRFNDVNRRCELDYVVWSYGTPVAWVAKVDGLIGWVIPDVRYSVTTSKHQSKLRAAITPASIVAE